MVDGVGGYLNVTFLPVVGVTAHAAGCGPVEFGGMPIPNSATVTFPTSATPYSLAASTCSAYAFQGWTSTGGIALNSTSANPVLATLTGNATVTAVYATVGGGPEISVFSADPNPLVLGGETNLTLIATGGSGSLNYSIEGLPPGCSAGGSFPFACRPPRVGAFPLVGTVRDATGAYAESSLTLTVEPAVNAVTVAGFLVTPGSITIGETLTLMTNASGGFGTLAYLYTGLPGGCVTRDTATWSCVPSSVGTYEVGVTVSDSMGHYGRASAQVHVENASSSAGSASLPGATVYVAGAAIGLTVLVAAALLLRRRNRNRDGGG